MLRKKPKQSRSQATVNACLEATARILEQEGLQALTTNRVAEVAGVSVGSLYQYFPNKSSLLLALAEHHAETDWEDFGNFVSTVAGARGHSALEVLVSEMTEKMTRRPRARQILAEVTKTLGPSEVLINVRKRYVTAINSILNRPAGKEADAWVVYHTLETATAAIAFESKDSAEREARKQSLVRLLEPVFSARLTQGASFASAPINGDTIENAASA
jgi:AcrR family transcriptional regulator